MDGKKKNLIIVIYIQQTPKTLTVAAHLLSELIGGKCICNSL